MPRSIEQHAKSAPEEGVFVFRPITHADFPLLFRWLRNPAVVKWWDDPPATMAEIEGKHVPRLDGTEAIYGFIATYAGVPMGFLQWYRLATEPEHSAVGLAPIGSAAIDLFIGEDDYRTKGYGPVMIRAFLRSVIFAEPDIASCAIDPCLANSVAIAAYHKAGFRDLAVRWNAHEKCDSQIMLCDREALL